MTDIQIISRVLNTHNISIIVDNGLDDSFFPNYSDEYKYIVDHYKQYGSVPDKETFLSRFPDFDILEVAESDKYLVDTINEEHLYSVAVPVINRLDELMQSNSNDAVEYLQSQLPILTAVSASANRIGVDIVANAKTRYEEYVDASKNTNRYFIETGFQELDEIVGGWHRGEELVVLFARSGIGKSWVLIKMLEHAWRLNARVGLIEPEMSASKTGYRFDTTVGHFSNRALTRGEELDSYSDYVQTLSENTVPFIVAHPKDFNRKVTVSKLKNFIQNNNLDILAVDGISYLSDERQTRQDSITAQLTHISEDLMDLSIELEVPIIVVAQSNRAGTQTEEPELENIRDSDGIAYNSSIVIALAQKRDSDILTLAVKKNRNGVNGGKLNYHWNADTAEYSFIPVTMDDTEPPKTTRARSVDSGGRF